MGDSERLREKPKPPTTLESAAMKEKQAVLPSGIKPIEHTIRDAASASKAMLDAVSLKLPAGNPLREAMELASKPRNIEGVSTLRGSTAAIDKVTSMAKVDAEIVYTMEITFKGHPMILAIGIGPKYTVATLTDRNTGEQIASLIHEPKSKSGGEEGMFYLTGPGGRFR